MGDGDLGSTPSSGAASSEAPVIGNGMPLLQCQDIIDNSFSKNPKVKFLVENLEKSGCRIGSNFIQAVNCEQQASGGFRRGDGIEICSNYLNFRDEVEQTMIHELIHAYDDCRAANLRWGNSGHQACSEIRANHLSGDCHLVREILRGNLQWNDLKIKGYEPVCVKRRAMLSVAANSSEAEAKKAVEAVWDTCYNDTAPFDRAL